MFRKKMHFGQLSLKKAHLFISCVSLNCVRAKYGLDLPEEEYSVFRKDTGTGEQMTDIPVYPNMLIMESYMKTVMGASGLE